MWRPDGPRGPVPVVVLIHGGFWRQQLHEAAHAPAGAGGHGTGWMAYNIEYRRVGRLGRGGWPGTFEDVSDAIDALAGVDGVDLRRVATCGHSAGGHLALWAAATRSTGDPQRPAVAVDVVAGCISGRGGGSRGRGTRGRRAGAVDALMGGGPDDVPERYRLGSPAALLPIGKPQFLLHGSGGRLGPTLAERALRGGGDGGR